MSQIGFEDLINNVRMRLMLESEAEVTTSDVETDSLDLEHAAGGLVIINVGETQEHSANHHTRLVIQHSDDDSTWVDVTDESVIQFKIGNTITAMEDATTGLLKAINEAGDDDEIYTVMYTGPKRYVIILLEETGTTTAGDFGVVGFAFDPQRRGASAVLGST